MNKKHLRKLWAKFRKYDKDKSGAIDMDEFYALIHEKRCIFGDSIFELIDIDNNGTALRAGVLHTASRARGSVPPYPSLAQPNAPSVGAWSQGAPPLLRLRL